MSVAFELTKLAAADIESILQYIDIHSGPRRALGAYRDILAGIRRVAEHPMIGHSRDDLGDPSLRAYRVHPWMIVYIPRSRPVQVIRVVHGARDMRALFDHE